MVEGDVETPPVAGDAHQPGDLRLFDGFFAGELGEDVDVEGFAQTEVFEGPENRRVELLDPPLEQRCELRGDGGASA